MLYLYYHYTQTIQILCGKVPGTVQTTRGKHRHMLRTRLMVVWLLVALFGAACTSQPTTPAGSAPAQPAPTQAVTATNPITTPTTTIMTATTTTTTPTITQTIPLTVAGYELQVELATTQEQRSQGLMFREDLPANGGMLFVFPYEREVSFWMKNTPLPLSIAFLDAEKHILNIADMQPFDQTSHRSAGRARYALEVHQGWFAERGIEAGAVCEFQLPADVTVQ
jgi:hypothetical protein